MSGVSAIRRGQATAAAVAAIALVSVGPAGAAVPVPVYGPAADPGVAHASGEYVAFTTGSLTLVARGASASGPWSSRGSALDRLGSWSSGGPVWAPDAWQTAAGWVQYYAAPARGMEGQRCIGVATADDATGPYVPADTPLVCPNAALGADDQVPGRPVADAGVIDPAPFLALDGRRFLLYKTQQRPSTLRMVRLGPEGLHTISASRELRQSPGIIENPAMVQRGRRFVLFASRHGWAGCGYATVWFRSMRPWAFADKSQHVLARTGTTGICGPGGMDVVRRDSGARIFLHGWRCEYRTGIRNCASSADVSNQVSFRSMYAGVLGWGPDRATPRVARFLTPASSPAVAVGARR